MLNKSRMKALLRCLLIGSLLLIISRQAIGQQANQVIRCGGQQHQTSLRLASADMNGTVLRFSLQEFYLNAVRVAADTMLAVSMPGAFLPNEEGSPDLPAISRMIAMPQGAKAVVAITSCDTVRYTNFRIAPAARLPKDNEADAPGPVKNPGIYNNNAFFPAQSVQLSKPMKMRGVDVVMIGITPFQYNPVTQELLVFTQLEISVRFESGSGLLGEQRLRSRWWDPLLNDMVFNNIIIPGQVYPQNPVHNTGQCEYLIIAPDDADFLRWADSVRMFRIHQGISANVVSTTEIGGNTVTAIESYINNAYNSWDTSPVAVLLLGDYGTTGNTVVSPVYNNYCASDNIFADVDGDQLPDLVIARITARNASDLQVMVSKFLHYERKPPVNPGFYQHPVTAMGWQTSRWFQLCSEVINGYFTHVQGKSPVRENAIYAGMPQLDPWSEAPNTQAVLSYFGGQGLHYIPDSPSFLTDWNGNASHINADINAGAFIVQHRDHGMETGWGEPAYSIADLDGLSNTDLPFVFSTNCLTGKFNLPVECFAEKFHRSAYGALGLIAASEVSYSFVNDTYVWGLYDYLWPDFMPEAASNPLPRGLMPAFANVAGKYFLQQSGWPYNNEYKNLTYQLFHHHGDAFTVLYSEVPQQLNVNHDEVIQAEAGTFQLQADQGALVCLSVNDEILALTEATGDPQQIPLPAIAPGSNVYLTITRRNSLRYERILEVVPSSGPYCVAASVSLSDQPGNGNGLAENGELAYLNLTVKNLGFAACDSLEVRLNTTDNYLRIIEGEAAYGSIEAGETKTLEHGFMLYFNDDFPDGYQARVQVTASSDNKSWNSDFFVSARAPLLSTGALTVDDQLTGNGNGILDPGETAFIHIPLHNQGGTTANNIRARLSTYSKYISLLSETASVAEIQAGQQAVLQFKVYIAADAPADLTAEIHLAVEQAGSQLAETFYPKIGRYREDFESGDFSTFNWQFYGSAFWTIDANNPFDGLYHARSGVIPDEKSCVLRLAYKTLMNDSIVFYRKVSSEDDADRLRFVIDNQQVGSWSGTSQGYSREAFYVPQGAHVFQWVYEKNASGTDGEDCAWLDNISLPSPMRTTLFAGGQARCCAGADFHCDARATNISSLQWETGGDGVFTDANTLDATYHPGSADLEAGQVQLLLRLTDNDNANFADTLTLTFTQPPAQALKPTGPVSVDRLFDKTNEYVTSPIENATSYAWTLMPETAGLIISKGTSALVVWAEGFVGTAHIGLSALNECGSGLASETLAVEVFNTLFVNNMPFEITMRVWPNPGNGLIHVETANHGEGKLLLELFNQTGTLIKEAEYPLVSGSRSFTIDITSQPAGLYVLVCRSNKAQSVIRYLLLR